MRKHFAVALALVLLVSAVGVLTLAEDLDVEVDSDKVVEIYNDVESVTVGDKTIENVKKLIVVTPAAFDGESYELHAKESGKVVVAVDPIHVTE